MPHKSLLSRPLDVIYFIFFLTHIPVMYLVDLTPLYPRFIHDAFPFLNQLRSWYIATYRDRFFSDPPAFFKLFCWMEFLLHTPVSVWAVGALWRDDTHLPLPLLLFATQVAITTATCIVEYLSWDDFSAAERLALGQLYVPYLGVAVFMGVDMWRRLSERLGRDGRVGRVVERMGEGKEGKEL